MFRFLATVVAFSFLLGPVFAAQPAHALPPAQAAAPVCGGIVPTDADATVQQSQPTTAFGMLTDLRVIRDSRSGDVSESLLHFPSLADVVQPGFALVSAELELALAPVPGVSPFTVNVAGVAGGWSERAVTWNNRPPARGDFGARSYHYEVDVAVPSVRIDVTPLVNLWLTGVVTETTVLLRPGEPATDARFVSLQGAAGTAATTPRLILRCKPAAKPVPLNTSPLDARQAAGLDRLRTQSAKPLKVQLEAGAVRFAGFDLALPSQAGKTGMQRARSVHADL